MKNIYSFNVIKKVPTDVKTETADGTLTKTELIDTPVKIILKSPSIKERSEAEEFQAIEWNKAVSSGIMTKKMLVKMYSDSGGVLSKEEIKFYDSLVNEYNSLLTEYQELSLVKGKKNQETKDKLEEILDKLKSIYSDISQIDLAREDLFRNSAESRAKDKTIQWLTLFLTYIEKNGKPVQFFSGDSYSDKLEDLFAKEDSGDEFDLEVLKKSSLFISLWFLGKISEKEDFEKLEKTLNES
jgi:hypothetical protein